MIDSDLDSVLVVEASGGIVRVWHGRAARDLEETEEILARIDEVLTRTSIALLLFDSRDSDRTPEEVQGRIWSWLTSHPGLRRVATVMKSAPLSDNVRMTGLSRGVRIRAFSDEQEARSWLLSR